MKRSDRMGQTDRFGAFAVRCGDDGTDINGGPSGDAAKEGLKPWKSPPHLKNDRRCVTMSQWEDATTKERMEQRSSLGVVAE
jgi:hypothetical protein